MQQLKEITFFGILLGAIITIIFTATNVYLGLKVGLTFASSIPAAVFSIAFFRMFGRGYILENNIVQTQVSAAGTLSVVVFIIPALFFVGYWNGFYFWETFLICAGGGILGVIFTIPFRIQLVEKNKLPYPEGRAAAEVLKLGEKNSQQATGAKEMFIGASLSAIFTFLSQGMKIFSDGFGVFYNAGKAIFQIPLGFSLALIGAGWLVGLSVGIAILLGIILSWGVLVPILSAYDANVSSQIHHALINASNLQNVLEQLGTQVWKDKVRFIGVGIIGVAAIWTLLKMLKPTFLGLKNSFSISIQPRTQQDLSLSWMIRIFFLVFFILIAVFYKFVSQANLDPIISWTFVIVMSSSAVLIGFLISATCGYMAGLVGSSSSPISGVGIIAVVLLSLITLALTRIFSLETLSANSNFFIALALFSTSVVFAIAAIANDNLQDLKTGQLVGATPWKQEVVLMIGCIVGALVIAPTLNLLYEAYGFVGHLPRQDMNEANALSAPQAILMSSIAEGIFKNILNWFYIGIGIAIGVLFIFLDFLCKKKNLSIPPLAVGMGIYLPPIVTIPIFFGSLLAYLATKQVDSKHQQDFKHKGILLASGLIVGESLMGIILAGWVGISIKRGGNGDLFDFSLNGWEHTLGSIFFVIVLAFIYKYLTQNKRG